MKRQVHFRATARRDIADIGDFSQKRWGTARTRSYLLSLYRTIDGLAENPMLGSAAELARPDLRKLGSGSHVVFYLVSDAQIEIVRVLHERMDFAERLR